MADINGEMQGRGGEFKGVLRVLGVSASPGAWAHTFHPLSLPPSVACVVDPSTEKGTKAQKLEMTCPRSPAVRWLVTQTERAMSETRSPHKGELPSTPTLVHAATPCRHISCPPPNPTEHASCTWLILPTWSRRLCTWLVREVARDCLGEHLSGAARTCWASPLGHTSSDPHP